MLLKMRISLLMMVILIPTISISMVLVSLGMAHHLLHQQMISSPHRLIWSISKPWAGVNGLNQPPMLNKMK
jgi:hypothetical protein